MLNFEKVYSSKKQKLSDRELQSQSSSSQSQSLVSEQNGGGGKEEEEEEEEEFKSIQRNPNNIINVNRIHEILLSRNNHEKNNLLYIEKIADPGQINNYFSFTQISEAILTVLPNEPIINSSFVNMKILIFFEKQENVNEFETISQIKKNKRLLSKSVKFTLEKNSQNTKVFEINKQKFITTKDPIFKFNKRSDKKGNKINICKYSVFYAIATYYTSNNNKVLLSQLKYEQMKRENFLLESQGEQNKKLTEENIPKPDTIKVNIEFKWRN